MTNKEYAELLDFIDEKSSELDNVRIYRVHSSYDPKNSIINKITLKVNSKNGEPLPKNNGGLPKNFIQRSIQFREDKCNLEYIKIWIEKFIEEKRNLL